MHKLIERRRMAAWSYAPRLCPLACLLVMAGTLLIAGSLLIGSSEGAFAQSPLPSGVPYAPPPPKSSLTVNAVSDYAEPPTGEQFVVPLMAIDARQEKTADWPASFFGSYLVDEFPRFCTATLVGSLTLITAAHCVGADPTMTLRKGGDRWTATCEREPSYLPAWSDDCSSGKSCPTSADFALCLINLEKDKSAPNFGRHERLNIDATPIAIGGVVKLVGFGCTQKNQGGGSNMSKDVLTSGWARINGVPAPLFDYVATEWELKGAPVPAFAKVKEGANICPGDSGGAVYLSGVDSPKVRSIVALASRVYTKDNFIVGPSLLSATSTPRARKFFDYWIDKKKTDLCGVDSNHPSCPPP